MATIESAGATSLDLDVRNHYVIGGSVALLYRGLPVFAGEFGTWVPRGVEMIGGIYKLVWQNGSNNEFSIWDVDSRGNFLSQTATLIRTDPLLVSLEPGFNQDLSASNGIASNTIIEATGSTQLNSVATGGTSAYILSSTGSALGPQLKYGGALVASGQFGSWVPLGAELIGSVYKIVWKNGPDQFVVWDVDGSGNYLSQTAAVAGSHVMIRSLEAVFNQDFNGGGIETGTIVDTFGATRLTSVASTYVLSPTGSAIGPQLKYGGAAVTTNQFSGWTPVGAEQMMGGYQVVWQNTSNQFIIWNVDSNGNWLSQSGVLATNSLDVQLLEVAFGQNFNGGGTLSRAVIEAAGSTTLATIGSTYYGLSPSGSTFGPQLRYGGSLVTAGQFGAWTPVGAEQLGGGYVVVWKFGSADQYLTWAVDGSGNWMSQSAVVAGSNALIQTLEPGFGQDLGGGGTASRTVIESAASTTLASIANTWYVLSSTGSAVGQTLKYGGAAVTAGQFGGWAPLAAELSGGLYRMVWRNGSADQYLAWNVDTNGNYVSQGTAVSSSTWWSQSYENVVQYDINGDGTVGPTTSSIEAGGNTTLTQVADSYFLNYGNSNIQVRYGGAYAAVGQFNLWTPKAVESYGGMYRMAWKNGSADQYVAWNIDFSGNFVSQGATVSGSTWYLQSYEPVVNFDLNGDGLIGPTVSSVESTGMTSLTKVADSYFLNYGSAPIQVLYGGSYAGSNQFPNWTAVGAEQTVGSYMVVWRNSSSGNYTVWNLDGSGNYIWNSAELGAGTAPFNAMETAVGQDFNGGGVAGKTTIEGSGSTALYNVSGYLEMVRGPYTGPLLAYGANYVTASQFGTALGAEWTGGGYTVAWKVGNDTYNFWNTDATGRFSSQTGSLAGSSAQMQNYEYTFNQDLNADGVIGINNTPFDILIVFSGPSQYQTYFEQAAQRWERIIRSDLSAVNSSTYGLIDDLRIDASVQAIDGTNGILAQAGWDLRRSSSEGGLPYHGIMRFDSADITAMVNNGTFLSVVMHEMGHVLGLGTLWDTFGLRSGSSYTGANANARYRELGGSGFVPLETTGGSGTAFAHWSEARFDRELMTGFSETGPPMPLSTITIGGLQDLGYAVDYAQADPYSLGGLMAPDSYVDDSGQGGLGAIGSMLAAGATGGGDTLAFNDAYDGPTVIDDRGQASTVGILTDFVDEGQGAGNNQPDVSLLTTYMASSFVTPPGEGAGNVATAQTTPDDILTRPNA